MNQEAYSLSVIVLTFNESKHIGRCLDSLKGIARNIVVVDSYSTDDTASIAKSKGAMVFQRGWKNYADQFQWALDNCSISTDWVMRMDADEYIESDLAQELPGALAAAPDEVLGFYIKRKYIFLGKWVKNGGVYPLNLLRVWRTGRGKIEQRWMDEHIVVDDASKTRQLDGGLVDDNLNNTRWWTDKHNKYADREMIDVLDRKYGLFSLDNTLKEDASSSQAKLKRILKDGLYNRFPLFLRPAIYFIYRYFFRLGFLDGVRGFAFHFFQGYWYRSLVDLRVYEAERLLDGAADNAERIARLEELVGMKLQ